MNPAQLQRRIRRMLIFFVVALVLSGVTAFPVYSELKWGYEHGLLLSDTLVGAFLLKVWAGVEAVNAQFPFLFYGYDWLAFAHIVIAMAFIGPYRDPVRNVWVIDWAMLACMAVFPLALIAGPIRGIPWFHILIDCCFGIIGLVPLWLVRGWIKRLESLQQASR